MASEKEKTPFESLTIEIGHYWRAYGGAAGLLSSPYLYLAFVLACIIYLFKADSWCWAETATSVLPNLLGFTLGGYAVMLAIGDKHFQNCLRGADPDESPSPYMRISASIMHFIIVQIISLIIAVVCKALQCMPVFSFFGLLAFIYALCLSFAAAFSIFFLSRMYDEMPSRDNTKDD